MTQSPTSITDSVVAAPAARSSALQPARVAAAAITAQLRRIRFVDGISASLPIAEAEKLSGRALIPHAGFEIRLADFWKSSHRHFAFGEEVVPRMIRPRDIGCV